MAVDYDLVIVGGSPIARYAAARAASLKARVALIEPADASSHLCGDRTLYSSALAHLAHLAQQQHLLPFWGLPASATMDDGIPLLRWQDTQRWVQMVAEVQAEEQSLSLLAAIGVDVIVGNGEFCRRPRLGLTVNGRLLRSRSYLISCSSYPAMPPIEGLNSVDYVTLDSLWQTNWETLPETIMVIGTDPTSVEVAQAMRQLGSQVTLIVDSDRLLPYEDPDIANLIQAQLDADGIRTLTGTSVLQAKQLAGKTWVQAGVQALETDVIVLATGRQPDLDTLNLEGAGVKQQAQGIVVNALLQTTNPKIYACGDAIGNYAFPHIAQREADTAIQNALFLPTVRMHPHTIPWAILTNPQVARVGLTEGQARQRFGDDMLVVRQSFKTLTRAQLQSETTGFCKLIVKSNGEILGAHLVGAMVSELIHSIALAMQNNIKLSAIANCATISPTFSEILQRAALDWQQQRLEQRSWLQTLIETWFDSARSWSR